MSCNSNVPFLCSYDSKYLLNFRYIFENIITHCTTIIVLCVIPTREMCTGLLPCTVHIHEGIKVQ